MVRPKFVISITRNEGAETALVLTHLHNVSFGRPENNPSHMFPLLHGTESQLQICHRISNYGTDGYNLSLVDNRRNLAKKAIELIRAVIIHGPQINREK